MISRINCAQPTRFQAPQNIQSRQNTQAKQNSHIQEQTFGMKKGIVFTAVAAAALFCAVACNPNKEKGFDTLYFEKKEALEKFDQTKPHLTGQVTHFLNDCNEFQINLSAEEIMKKETELLNKLTSCKSGQEAKFMTEFKLGLKNAAKSVK